MKKVELHLHLDGSCNVELASKIVGRDVHNDLISSNAESLADYLTKFELPIKLLQDLVNIEEFSYLLGKELEKDGVIYAEVRFCPLFHIEKYSIDEVAEAIIRGFRRIDTVKVNLIFCMMRNFSIEENRKIIRLTKHFLGKGVVAIDLAGDEKQFKTSDFEELFEEIRLEKIPFTIHAGEADSWESVLSAIEFGTSRIGHGIRSIESDEVLRNLIEKRITLEVCPTSNIDTRAVLSIQEHPIKKLVDAGVCVTINTDNRTVSNTTLSKEYDILCRQFHFTDEDFLQFNLNAINAAFISEEEKKLLRGKLFG